MTGPDVARIPGPVFMSRADGTRLIYLLLKQARPGFEAVQFVASHGGEGTSSVVRDLGLIAAALDIRVLILDCDDAGQGHAVWLDANCVGADGAPHVLRRWPAAEPGRDIVASPGSPDLDILQIAGASLFVSWRPDGMPASPARLVQTLAGLRGKFDLILIDTAAFDRSADSLLLAPQSFATLLVMQAERTRVRTADDLRAQLLECGAAVPGMVLNRRRRYIPQFIYDRL